MALTPEARASLQASIEAQDRLPIVRIPAIIGGKKSEDVSILYRTCTPVEITPEGLNEARTIVDEMTLVLKTYREITQTGRAFAANQIGIDRMIVIFLHPDGTVFSYINPEITWKSEERNIYWEVCMSGSPLGVDVVRPASVKVHWYDLDGNEHHELLEGFDARRMQHEIEHLDGKVCYNTDGTVHSTLGYGLDKSAYMKQELRPV